MTPAVAVVERAYLDVVGVGIYIGIIHAIPGDSHPDTTYRRQVDKIYQMVKRKQIPYIKRGRKLYFEKQAVDKWMREGANRL